MPSNSTSAPFPDLRAGAGEALRGRPRPFCARFGRTTISSCRPVAGPGPPLPRTFPARPFSSTRYEFTHHSTLTPPEGIPACSISILHEGDGKPIRTRTQGRSPGPRRASSPPRRLRHAPRSQPIGKKKRPIIVQKWSCRRAIMNDNWRGFSGQPLQQERLIKQLSRPIALFGGIETFRKRPADSRLESRPIALFRGRVRSQRLSAASAVQKPEPVSGAAAPLPPSYRSCVSPRYNTFRPPPPLTSLTGNRS